MGAHNSKSKRSYNAKPSAYYFYVKEKISVDFQISVPLSFKAEHLREKFSKIWKNWNILKPAQMSAKLALSEECRKPTF